MNSAKLLSLRAASRVARSCADGPAWELPAWGPCPAAAIGYAGYDEEAVGVEAEACDAFGVAIVVVSVEERGSTRRGRRALGVGTIKHHGIRRR